MSTIKSLVLTLLHIQIISCSPARGGDGKKSSNYAGAVTFGENIVEVSADIVVPVCTVGVPKVDYVLYTSDGWVGLGAYSKQALLQTGITCNANETYAEYLGWTEWAPEPPVFYPKTEFRPGDVVHAGAIALSRSSGITYLENRRTGQNLSTSYVDQTQELIFGDAEWITESQLQNTELGIQGRRGATYTPWRFQNATYRIQDETTRQFELSTSSDHMIYTVFDGVKIAEGVYNGPGSLQVNDTTPANYTVPGLR